MQESPSRKGPTARVTIDINNLAQVNTWKNLFHCSVDDIITAVFKVGNSFDKVAEYLKNRPPL